MSLQRLDRGLGARLLAGLVLGALTTLASAAPPFLHGPSVMRSSETAIVSGGNFPPRTAITVMVVQPNGTRSAHSAVVAEDGSMRYDLNASGPGRHLVRVTDSGGRPLASTVINFSR